MARGSLNGVEFRTVDHSTTFGHRQPTAALPFQNRGKTGVNLGRMPIPFRINGFVIGDDYRAQRDALREVVEAPGPYTLVHPEYGRVSVWIPKGIQFRESTAKLRCAELSFEAEEAFDQEPQTPTLDTGSALKAAAKAGRAATIASFSDPRTGLQQAISDYNSATNFEILHTILADMRKVNGAITAVLAAPGRLAAQIDSISRVAAELLSTPRRLMDSIDGAFELLGQAVRRVLDTDGTERDASSANAAALPLRRGKSLLRAVDPVATLGASTDVPPDVDTLERQQEISDRNALLRHTQASGLFNLAAAAADTAFDNRDAALEVRDALAEALSALADSEPDLDSALSSALKITAALTVEHLTRAAGRLGELVDYTPQTTLPPEVAAHVLYGDAERADEIVLRNPQVKHPGMLPAKEALEVLSR